MKIPSAISSSRFRPCRSPSFPHSGVLAAAATTYAVTSHETSVRRPRSAPAGRSLTGSKYVEFTNEATSSRLGALLSRSSTARGTCRTSKLMA